MKLVILSLGLLALVNGDNLTPGQYHISDGNGLGREFDGIGAISGGGATSKLLVSYPEPQRSQVLDYLFKPNYGASLQILKIEIGGDDQTTDGSETSHMHTPDDLNFHRGYEWWMMKEAKKRNPNIKLWALAWCWPFWLKGTLGPVSTPWGNITNTAAYIMNWIRGAKAVHGLDIDYVGVWNERPSDFQFILKMRDVLDSSQFSHIQIAAPDTTFLEFPRFYYNKKVLNSIYAFGVHYPGTKSSGLAKRSGKKLWASEDYSTYNDEVGAGCWARILNRNMVNGSMTSTTAWNLVSGYYPQLPYTRNGLMDAFSPWSGQYQVRDPIWVTAHTTQFTAIGWHYLPQSSGVGTLLKRGSYVALTDPRRSQLTMIVETMSHDHSICVRPKLAPYDTEPQNATFFLTGSFAGIRQLYHWKTQLVFGQGAVSNAFQQQAPIQVDSSGRFSIYLSVDSIHTFTTMKTGLKGTVSTPQPPFKPFPMPYVEDMSGYPIFGEPKYLAQQVGSWEVLAETDGTRFARQTTPFKPVNWCPNEIAFTWPLAVIGNGTHKDLNVTVNVRVPDLDGAQSVMIGARVQGGGCDITATKGALFWINPRNGQWSLSQSMAHLRPFDSGTLPSPPGPDAWFKVTLVVQGGRVSVYLNTVQVTTVNLPSEIAQMGCTGTDKDFCNAAIGSDRNFGYSDWAQLHLTPA